MLRPSRPRHGGMLRPGWPGHVVNFTTRCYTSLCDPAVLRLFVFGDKGSACKTGKILQGGGDFFAAQDYDVGMTENNKIPKILQVVPALEQGGVEVGTLEIGRYLVAQGWGSFVVSNGGGMQAQLTAEGTKHFHLPLHRRTPWHIMGNAFKLAKLVKTHKIDLMHARSRGPAWSTWLASKLTGVPFITTFHGIYGHESAIKRFYNSSMVRGRKTIANSRYTLTHVQNIYRVPPSHLALAPRGYDETRYNGTSAPADQVKLLRQSWNPPMATTPILMMVARLAPWKGHRVVIEALGQLQNQKWLCVFVGSGRPEFEAELKALCLQNGIAERIVWAGFQENVPLYLAAADVCISASTQPEAFGRTVVEAQAMGTPVIATNHGGPMELIDRNITGWFVPPNNANALAQAIKKALQQPLNDRKNMSAACRAWASQFTTEKMCAAEVAVYKDVLNIT